MTPIDAYFKNVEPSKRRELKRIRDLAKEIVPDAEEAIVYAMPTLKYRGKPFLGFAARANHIGIYPYSGAAIATLEKDLRGFACSKGALRVPLDAPIPKGVLRKIVQVRLREIRAETPVIADSSKRTSKSRPAPSSRR